MATCDAESLLNEGKCFGCLNQKQISIATLQLLCNIFDQGETPPGTNDVNLVEVGGGLITLGQKLMAESVPIVIASDQPAIPISGDVNLIEVGGAPVSLGQKASVDSIPVVLPSDMGTLAVVSEASATGDGTDTFRSASVTNAAQAVKASSGRVYGYNFFNPGVALAYLHFYDVAAGGVVVGTTVPKLSIALASNATAQVGVDSHLSVPCQFGTAITISATTTPNGGGAPGSSLVANIFFK